MGNEVGADPLHLIVMGNTFSSESSPSVCSCALPLCLPPTQQWVLPILPILPISIQMLICCSFRCFPWGRMGCILPATPSHTITDWGGGNLSVSFNQRITSSVCSYRNLIVGCISSSFNFEILDDAFQFKKLIFR